MVEVRFDMFSPLKNKDRHYSLLESNAGLFCNLPASCEACLLPNPPGLDFDL
jgi:hypothetical protein